VNTEPQINGRFKPDDFKDVVGLASKLCAGTTTIDKYLVGRLSAAGVDAVAKAAEPEADLNALKSAFATELNRICDGELIYDEIRFAAIERRRSTRRLLGKNPQGPALFRLNKLLLEDAFLAEIYRQKGRGRNAVQKPATVHYFKKSNVWGVLVNLVAPRELEGKMRSGRQKFERQTQDLANDLCLEINNKLFGKELARQLSKREETTAKKLFWELLEPKHPDWIDHTDRMVEHCEKTCFRVAHTDIPNTFEAAKIYWAEHVRGHEPQSRINSRNMLAYLLPAFGTLKPFEMTDAMVLLMAYGKKPLAFWKTTSKPNQTVEEEEKRRWDTPTISKSKRPWTHYMKVAFLRSVRAFKNWMHASKDPVTQEKRNWCPPPEITLPDPPKIVPGKAGEDEESDEVLDAQCKKNPALTIPQCQAVLDVAHIAFDGGYAAFYAHGFFGGSRVTETKKMGTRGFDPDDGVQSISAEAAKKDEARESTLFDNLIIMVSALKSAGLYTNKNLRPNQSHRAVIHMLAGFTSNSKQAHRRANWERKRLAALGIILPRYNWEIPFPPNSLRRTSLSMHYKLFKSVGLTVEWAGNSKEVFKPYYKRLVTKTDARKFWLMLPSLLKTGGEIQVNLPANHQLDSAMTKEVAAAIPVACQAMSRATAKTAAAKATLAAAKSKALKARNAAHSKKSREKTQAKKRAAQPEKGSDNAAGAPPLPKAA
jgi:hypothetical protein